MKHEHIFIKSNKKDYEICIHCGSYHSTNQKTPDELYVNNPYWGNDRSTIEQQVSNLTCTDDCGISKVDRMLQFLPPHARNVLEIGCCPGVLLKKLADLRCVTVGIEPSQDYIEFIGKQSPTSQLICGYFPYVFSEKTENVFDCIMGMDIFEHIEDGELFMSSVHRLLVPDGVGVFMSPIILEDKLYRERDFYPSEHYWIYTKKYLEPFLKSIFREVKFTRWVVGHEVIIVSK